jgi:hypothetical protein
MSTEPTFPRIANIYGAGLSPEATEIDLQPGDGAWRHEFENGLAVVNPRPHRVHLTFPRIMRDYSTGWSGREFVIPTRNGRMYFPVGSAH